MELDDLILASETFIIQVNYTILYIFNSYFLINTIYRNIFYLMFYILGYRGKKYWKMNERAREILLPQPWRLRSAHFRYTCVSLINNRIDRLQASAYFPAITAAAVRCPGGCRPSRRVHRVVVTGQRQQGSGIDDGSRFGKLFLISNLSDDRLRVLFSCCRYL